MKRKLLYLFVMAAFLATINSSCRSKMERRREKGLSEAIQSSRLDTLSDEGSQAWRTFRDESKAKIKEFENKIDELRNDRSKPGKPLDEDLDRQLNELKIRVREIRENLENYGESSHDNWESFKREFNHDMNGIGKALKDLTVDNEK